eukprot:Phypoly_transcript_18389.p1 GENE.Phypoly_transcript_18389~~Phypoly_transcript_18389.p1  ORF type:complete len:103 (+),score=4.22 Phypoly_transcript_18389:407-715(+)
MRSKLLLEYGKKATKTKKKTTNKQLSTSDAIDQQQTYGATGTCSGSSNTCGYNVIGAGREPDRLERLDGVPQVPAFGVAGIRHRHWLLSACLIGGLAPWPLG